jgi:hypothetical protein
MVSRGRQVDYGARTYLVDLLPFNYQQYLEPQGSPRQFQLHYPKGSLKCSGGQTPSIFLFTLASNGGRSPYQEHLEHHAHAYDLARSGNGGHESAVFGLLYGLTSIYEDAVNANAVLPRLLTELQRRDYLFLLPEQHPLPNLTSSVDLQQGWPRTARGLAPLGRPVFAWYDFPAGGDLAWENIELIMKELPLEAVRGSIFLFAGTAARPEDRVPLYIIWPDRSIRRLSHPVNLMQLSDSLLRTAFRCDGDLQRPLSEPAKREWEILAARDQLYFLDYGREKMLEFPAVLGSHRPPGWLLPAQLEATRYFRP